jgi:hypothetical protein
LIFLKANGASQAKKKDLDIPQMARLWSCIYFRMPTQVSILDTDCAKYYTDELQMAVMDLEKNKNSPLSKALFDGRSCAVTRTGFIYKSDLLKNPNKTSVYETIDYCFGDHKIIANRLKSAFEEIIAKKEELTFLPKWQDCFPAFYLLTLLMIQSLKKNVPNI